MPKLANKLTPVIFVLFGATGDLAVKKIFPALNSLWAEGAFHKDSKFIAVSRRDWDDSGLHSFLKSDSKIALDAGFAKALSYSKADIDEGTGYGALEVKIEALEAKIKGAERLIYLSLGPKHFAQTLSSLRDSKVLARGSTKLLLEKPFGTDEKSACELDLLISSFLDEKQVHRVDHYLGKDTVRAIMDIHESSPGFLELLKTESVKSILVRIFETKGIEGRGASYDHVGAFRDVGQNHMIEMLAVVCAEPCEGETWQISRAEVLKRLALPAKTCDLSRRGQYKGYLDEKGVVKGSETETAFEIVTSFSSGKLRGVPLTLESGKMMKSSEVFVEIEFKDIADLPKKMIFRVQPDQEIAIEYRDGHVDTYEVAKTRDAYANIIAAAISGSAREFVGREEIEALWRYADRVVACWSKVPLETYDREKPFLSLLG